MSNSLNIINKRSVLNAHPYHLVDTSPWPITTSYTLLILTTGSVMSFHNINFGVEILFLGLITTILSMSLWFRDVITEGSYLGYHTLEVGKGLSLGVGLFITSEVMFFLSIFWAFFHSSLSPSVELGSIWPPFGIEALNPFELPLLNTIILLSSGSSVTYAHHSLIEGNRKATIIGLTLTVMLAIIFTSLQGYEYYNCTFTITDSVFGSCFFMGTGFHGLHVIIGSLWLIVSFWRFYAYQLTDSHHIGFEGAILYWHFVDVVWLFLFVSMYWWGS